ncbi:MAG TPA: methyltransferase [bacterium]|nr:methyltransferase [bacterium]
MNSRERVKTALNHKSPDRVPVDFGGTGVTGMHVSCVAGLRDYYELEKKPVKVIEPYQMLGEIDSELIELFGIDTEPMNSRSTMFGFRNENWKQFRLPWGQEVLVSEEFNVTRDSDGSLVIYPEGDVTAPASGRMPVGSYFFDTIVRQESVDDEKLNPEDNLEEFKLLSQNDLEYYAAENKRAAKTGRAVVGGMGGTSFGDIAMVPAPFLKHPKGIRDIEEWYVSTAIRREYIHQIFSRQSEITLQNLEKFYTAVGDTLDVFFVCGTDFGTQTSSFCSVETYLELYAPYYKIINGWIHKNTNWKTFKHSCGAVEKFLPHFIESGFDVLNPVQCSAAGMSPQHLKENYGESIVFWGGGIDTQKTLPFGKPDDVRCEVLQRCEIFAPNGGFIFNAIHNIQAKTPVENIVAMFDALKEFNGS